MRGRPINRTLRTLREILSDGERGLAHQCHVLLLMQMLADGDPLPTLSDLLEEMVRDATWQWHCDLDHTGHNNGIGVSGTRPVRANAPSGPTTTCPLTRPSRNPLWKLQHTRLTIVCFFRHQVLVGGKLTMKCPACAEEIQDEAKVCKHCGRDFAADKVPRSIGKGCGVVMLVLMGGCFAAILLVPEDTEQSSLSMARAVTATLCEQRMTAGLRAPGTADYPFGHVAEVTALSDNRHRLESYVDSENAFGGQVRTRFVCMVQGEGDDLTGYRIVQFVIQ